MTVAAEQLSQQQKSRCDPTLALPVSHPKGKT